MDQEAAPSRANPSSHFRVEAGIMRLGVLTMTKMDEGNLVAGHSLSAGEIYGEMRRRLEQGALAAMATVVNTRGSTPQQTGAKMVIFADGSFIGTVGGGCVEADIWAEAREV